MESLPSIDYDIGEMYAGQIPVGNDTSKNMYYVFEPTIGEPVDEVTIWFNGGMQHHSPDIFKRHN